MVDANGGYTHRASPPRRRTHSTTWASAGSKNPSAATTPAGLAALRAALRCDIAAGEYAADLYDVRALLPVVDCLQLDATRCGGYTGWLRGAALAALPQPAGLRALRTVAARLRRRRRPEPAPRRMVRRPRPPRTAARRRAARGPRRSAAPGHQRARTRHDHPQRRRAMVRRMSPNTAPPRNKRLDAVPGLRTTVRAS